MSYKEELTKAMTWLGEQPNTIFIGQSVIYPGQAMFPTLEGVPLDRKIELPIMEDAQMGISIGLSLAGYIPISIYSRMDFLLLAMNQFVNHLDKIAIMSHGEFIPKVIIRTMVGSHRPLDGGLQHTQDYSVSLNGEWGFIPHIRIYQIGSAQSAVQYYQEALVSSQSCLMVEYGEKYGN